MKMILIILISVFNIFAYADVYKCIKDDKIIYQDHACNELKPIFNNVVYDKCDIGNSSCGKKLVAHENIIDEKTKNISMNKDGIRLCYTDRHFLFSEIKCSNYEKSSSVLVEEIKNWGKIVPSLGGGVGFSDIPEYELDFNQNNQKKVIFPNNVKQKVKHFKPMSGKFRIIKIGAHNGKFYKYTSEACLKGFSFEEKNLILQDEYTSSNECSYKNWMILTNAISYTHECIQNNKTASSRVTFSNDNQGTKFEVRVEKLAPSSYIQSDYSYELSYVDKCN